MAVRLNDVDDDLLFIAASALAGIADKLDSGEDVPNMAQLIRVAGMTIAGVMANAYEREIDDTLSYN